MSKLELRGITKYYETGNGRLLTLDNISLTVNDGEFLCIVGPSGCGKSTLLNIIAGLEKPQEGQVLLDGQQVNDTSPDRLVVFQEGALFPWLRVLENVEFGLSIAGVEKSQRQEIARRYLDMMHLARFENSYIHQLSTGMKQRVAIARGLAMDPQVLLMDEPFAALDAQTRDMLHAELQNIHAKTRKTIVFVTHNVRESACLADRVLVLTYRPATVKREFPINFPRPRQIEDHFVVDTAKVIFAELKDEVQRAVNEQLVR